MIIIGAGLTGLIAASIFQNAKVFEAGSEGNINHKALLRFRTGAVGDAVGIEFKKVRVRKGVWLDGRFVDPDIQIANWYSQKVVGNLASRSIWNIDAVDRFIAPEDFIGQMVDRIGSRIEWNAPATHDNVFSKDCMRPIISTIPMPILERIMCGGDENLLPKFRYAPINVERWRIKGGADVYQTVYFPSLETSTYRASITGDLLVAESVKKEEDCVRTDSSEVFEPFGLSVEDVEPIDVSSQRFGKIAPIDDKWRRRFIRAMTEHEGIYSLGRFAVWRNILLDDVLHDIAVVRRLISSDDAYGRAKLTGRLGQQKGE